MSGDPAIDSDLGDGPREVCIECGFDSFLYDRADTISSQWVFAVVMGAAADGLPRTVYSARPDKTTRSIVECIDHAREMVFDSRIAIEAALNEPDVDLGDPPVTETQAEPELLKLDATLEAASQEYRLMEELLQGLSDERWRASVTLRGEQHTVGWFGRHALHEGQHQLNEIGRVRHRFGRGARSHTGSVSGLHISDGGVPKRPVESTVIDATGVDGDTQSDRRHHGRPVQAVCLWSADVIEALQAEGHPIHAGAAGENVTISNVEWSDLLPGTRIDVGTVPMLISAHAIPCAKNAQWFSDRDFNRILHERNPGASRLYAIPLSGGTVSIGDTVSVEPAPDSE